MNAVKKRACVIGFPVRHSRSPLIHNYWIDRNKLSAAYELAEKSPEDFPDFLTNLDQHGYCGANITIPHKETAFKLMDLTDKHAERLGAVNTVVVRDGKLFGTNTDGEGFIRSLKQQAGGWSGEKKSCVILGAGGATRAIICALFDDGVDTIYLTNRTYQRAQDVADELKLNIQLVPWTERSDVLSQSDLLINTTSLGMTHFPPLEIDFSLLKHSSIVADIVYAPLETELLKTARLRGHQTIDGLGMLLHQAVRGFDLWFGITPEVTDELRELIVADLDLS